MLQQQINNSVYPTGIHTPADSFFMRFLENAFMPTTKWTVKTILTGGLIAASVAAILLTWSILRITTTIMGTSTAVSQTYEVISALNKLEANLIGAETAERGYVIAGEQNYLAPYLDAVKEVHWKMALISAFASDNPAQLSRVKELERLVSAKLNTLQLIVDTRKEGAVDAAHLLVSIEQDKLEMDSIRFVLDQMEEHVNDVLNVRIKTRDNTYRQFWGYFSILIALMFAGAIWQYHLVRRVIRYSEEAKEYTRYLAEHDALTGLPNRRLLQARLDLAISYAQRNGQMLAVMFLDLDGFKKINDTLGHQAGDELLKLVAQRLTGTIRANDTAARLGGDEFIVVLSGLTEIDPAIRQASELIAVVSQPCLVAGAETKVSVSIGISFYPDHGTCADALLQKADHALHQAKTAGKNRYKLASD